MNRRAIGFESWPISLFGESSAGANHVRNASCAPILRAPRVRGTADAVRAFEPGFSLTHDGRFESVVCTRDFRVSSRFLRVIQDRAVGERRLKATTEWRFGRAKKQ